jgi:uridine phosphorylase
MDSVRVLFLTAVIAEARALARAFHLAEASESLWRGGEVGLAALGVGARGLKALEGNRDISDVQLVIGAGLAGALSPELRPGEVVVDARGNGAGLPPLGNAYMGKIYTSKELVAGPPGKAELYASTHCVAVDMETDLMAGFAAARGAAFLAIRGISDTAQEKLDPAMLTLIDDAGRPRIGRAMGLLLRHPSKLAPMLRLQRASALAMENVVETAKRVVASGWPALAADRRASS